MYKTGARSGQTLICFVFQFLISILLCCISYSQIYMLGNRMSIEGVVQYVSGHVPSPWRVGGTSTTPGPGLVPTSCQIPYFTKER